MSDRIIAAILLVLAAVYGWEGFHLEAPFAYDPLGPNSFPVVLSSLLGLFSAAVLLRPVDVPEWPQGAVLCRVGLLAVTLLLYGALLFQLGFLLSTILAGAAIARLVDANWRQSLIAGIGTSGVFHIVFVRLLDVALPDGRLVAMILGS